MSDDMSPLDGELDETFEHTLEGRLIEERYLITRKIADGGMASVYEALDQRLSRRVALKIMRIQLAQGAHRQQFEERFHREVTSAAAIASPYIVQVYDTGTYHGLDYLVMEYVQGVNVRSLLNERGRISINDTLRIMRQTLQGLAAAHRVGVVHRDIKPENILINQRGDVQITDFGLARSIWEQTLSSTGMLLGTAAYLAPEMIERNEATPQGDLYAMGIMAWEMLMGYQPFNSDNPVTTVFQHVHQDVPPLQGADPAMPLPLSNLLSKLTARNAAQRPASATQALELLDQTMAALANLSASSTPTTPIADPTAVVPVPVVSATPAPAAPIMPATSTIPAVSMANPTPAANSISAAAPAVAPLAEQLTVTIPPREAVPMPAASSGAAMPAESAMPSTPYAPLTSTPSLSSSSNAATRRKRRWFGALAAVALACIALGGGFAWWWFLGPGSYWTLPSAEGLSCHANAPCTISNVRWQPYETQLKKLGIPYHVSDDFSDTIPQGSIISTSPSTVGAHVSKRRGESVGVVLSRGVRQATIPAGILDAASPAAKDPVQALKNAGFTRIEHDERQDEYSMDVPQGMALSIDPQPLTTLNYNAPVTLRLSKGLQPVTMPQLDGKSRDEVAQILQSLRLNVNWVEAFHDTIAANTVISATPAAGTPLHWKDTVNVTVSKGPQMAQVPDVQGKNTDEARKILSQLGFDTRIIAPLGDWTHTVRIQAPQPGTQLRVRDEQGKPTVITLTVA